MRGVANPKRREHDLTVGDSVFLNTYNLPLKLGSRKLAAKFAGPFTVLSVASPEAYRLSLPTNWKIHDVFHTS